jgi:hypothetical protein
MLAIPMAITIIRLVILRNVRIYTKYIKGVGYISTHIDTTHLALFQPSLSLPSCFFFFLSSPFFLLLPLPRCRGEERGL